MIRLRIKEILREKGVTCYWLYQRMGMGYQNFSRMINNEAKTIKYSILEALCEALDCTPETLFEYIPNQK